MRQDRPLAALLFWLAITTLVGVCIAGAARTARSQDEPLTPELALARLSINEAGISAYRYDDPGAIHGVIMWRREHVPAYRGDSYVEALHRYSNRAVVDRGGRGRPWIADLWPSGREPRGYCPTCAWSRGRRQWLRTYQRAVDLIRGDVEPPCVAHSWARSDVRPADPSAERVDCGNTRNVFWVIGRYQERWGSAKPAG